MKVQSILFNGRELALKERSQAFPESSTHTVGHIVILEAVLSHSQQF